MTDYIPNFTMPGREPADTSRPGLLARARQTAVAAGAALARHPALLQVAVGAGVCLAVHAAQRRCGR